VAWPRDDELRQGGGTPTVIDLTQRLSGRVIDVTERSGGRVIDVTERSGGRVIDVTEPLRNRVAHPPGTGDPGGEGGACAIDLRFHLIDAWRPDAAVRSVRLRMRAVELTGAALGPLRLRAETAIDLMRARHRAPDENRLVERFGAIRLGLEQSFFLANSVAVVPGFGGTTVFELRLPLPAPGRGDGYQYLSAVTAGDVPLRIDFAGVGTTLTPSGPVELELPEGIACTFDLPASVLAVPAAPPPPPLWGYEAEFATPACPPAPVERQPGTPPRRRRRGRHRRRPDRTFG
jgi:hypothetical protein